MKTRVGL